MIKKISLASAVILAGAGAASAQEACSVYTVRAGDSLSAIARVAYGSISFQSVWDANRTEIGGNPNTIRVGMQLRLPCADGTLPGTNASVVRPAAPAVPSEDGPVTIRLVTGSDYQPFTDEDMDGGGVFTQLVRAALDAVEADVTADIVFVNDWGSHLDVLLPSGAFDGTFPWVLPNCEAASLTDAMQARCDNFRFADPVYEIFTGMITRAGDSLATTTDFDAFKGKTVCVPDGYGAVVLAAQDVTEPDVTYARPSTPEACFEDLVAGSVDAVEMELTQAADIVGRLGMEDQVAVNDQISSISVLTVYVHKDNPDGDAILASLNAGLNEIRNSGVWFQTVRTGFSAYYTSQ